MINKNPYFPAEWEAQDAILMALPHQNTDWAYMLDEARECYFNIIDAIIELDQAVVLLVNDKEDYQFVKNKFGHRIIPVIIPFNDTWTRDYGPIYIRHKNFLVCNDFKFNGWGLKFPADKDNLVNSLLICKNIFHEDIIYQNRLNFVLEGGSIETDGMGTILTTAECLLSPNRNGEWNRQQIETYLKSNLGSNKILWLNYGKLEGDDTDGHIDTLARFCNKKTITYVKCYDKLDPHYQPLSAMENELKNFLDTDQQPYNLVPLPLPDPIYCDAKRLPATYCNFLIINNGVLVPTYKLPQDDEVLKIFTTLFPDKKVVGIDCRALIQQHGSLHCATMQLPKGSLVIKG
ncbi:MAG: agmatine deiminase family protein [Marinilabiliaceae bacterium]|nr:agmatine deiminase family protein [Marinilabiliaceae bacterium]